MGGQQPGLALLRARLRLLHALPRSVFTFFAEPIRVVFSDDGGRTWSNPTQISPAHNNNTVGGRQDSTVRSGPDGSVYVAWDDGDIGGNKQVVAISHDGGVSFSKPIKVAPLDGIDDRVPGANFRDGSYPSLGVDPRVGTHTLYDAWADGQGGTTGRIVVSKSTDGGLHWSAPVLASSAADGYAFFQGLDVAPNGRVDLAYQALKAVIRRRTGRATRPSTASTPTRRTA